MAWLHIKFTENFISCKAEVELIPHLSDLNTQISSSGGSSRTSSTREAIAALEAAITEMIQVITLRNVHASTNLLQFENCHRHQAINLTLVFFDEETFAVDAFLRSQALKCVSRKRDSTDKVKLDK